MKYLEYNGKSSADLGLRVIDYTRPSFAENRDVYNEIDGRAGMKHSSRADGMYKFSVRFRTSFYSEEERMKKMSDISEWLYTKEFVKIVQSDMPGRYREGKVDGQVEYTPTVNRLVIDVDFITNPYAVADSDTVSVRNHTEGKISHTQVVTKLGSAEAEFIYKITTGGTTSFLEVSVGDTKMKIDRAFTSGETVRIDTDKFRVELLKGVGVENITLDVYGEFPLLSKKDNTITVTGSQVFTCSTELKYREHYLM